MGKLYSLRDLPSNLSLTELEVKIVTARCAGDSIEDLSEELYQDFLKTTVSSSIAIYGFFWPTSQNLLDLIVSELGYYLKCQGFGHFTASEVYLAIQLNAKSGLKIPSGVDADLVKPFGATISIKFISDVLCLYTLFRDNLDRKFQNFIYGL